MRRQNGNDVYACIFSLSFKNFRSFFGNDLIKDFKFFIFFLQMESLSVCLSLLFPFFQNDVYELAYLRNYIGCYALIKRLPPFLPILSRNLSYHICILIKPYTKKVYHNNLVTVLVINGVIKMDLFLQLCKH